MISDWMKIIRKAAAKTLAELAARLDPLDPPDHEWKDEGGPPQHWVDYICHFDPAYLDERGHLRHPADILHTHAGKPHVVAKASSVAGREGEEATRQSNQTGTGAGAGNEVPRNKTEPTNPTSGKRQDPPKAPPSSPLSFLRHRVHQRAPETQSTQPPQSGLSRSLQFQSKAVERPQHETTAKQTATSDESPDGATPSPLRYPLRGEDADKENDTPNQNRHRHLPVHEKFPGERTCHPPSDPCPASAPVGPSQPFQPETNVPARLRAHIHEKQTLSKEKNTQDPKRNEIPASRDRIEEIRVQKKAHRAKPSETQEPTESHQRPCLEGVTPAQMANRWPCLPQQVPAPVNDSLPGEPGLPWLERDHLDQEQQGHPWRE